MKARTADRIVLAAKVLHVAALLGAFGYAIWWVVTTIYLVQHPTQSGNEMMNHAAYGLLVGTVLFGLVGLTRTLSVGSMRRRRRHLEDITVEDFFNPKDYTFLVAFEVTDNTGAMFREDVEKELHALLPLPSETEAGKVTLEGWWIAEDERYDRSDNDSAIFVPKGMQQHVEAILQGKGLDMWRRHH